MRNDRTRWLTTNSADILNVPRPRTFTASLRPKSTLDEATAKVTRFEHLLLQRVSQPQPTNASAHINPRYIAENFLYALTQSQETAAVYATGPSVVRSSILFPIVSALRIRAGSLLRNLELPYKEHPIDAFLCPRDCPSMALSPSLKSPTDYTPVSPTNFVDGSRRTPQIGFGEKKETGATTTSVRTNSSSSSSPSINTPRKARFAEATSVNSPMAEPNEHRLPFSRSKLSGTVAKPSDVGFGYISDNNPIEQHATLGSNTNGLASPPLRSALKTPGTSTRFLNPLSPTFREEASLEKQEEKTEKQQAKDLKVKTRVRMAKMVLRGVNFSCSLIVLSMLSTTFSIFNATKSLPPRNGLPAWSTTTVKWPQITVLVISCISLFFSIIVIGAYWRGGHKRAQKAAVYYTMFAMGYFVFSTVMWLIGAGVLHGAKSSSNGQDIWGWSCKDNTRKQLFNDDVHYALVCRLQDWSLVCCIIEVVVELITISIYGVVFYRFYSKNKLRKSMDNRDRARSDLYLAQLRSQSAPNTPGYTQTPRSPSFPVMKVDPYSAAENGQSPTQYASATTPTSGFRLQAPPIRVQGATPRTQQDGFEAPLPSSSPPPQDRVNEHVAAAPGEQQYDAVPIPGAYAGQHNSQAH